MDYTNKVTRLTLRQWGSFLRHNLNQLETIRLFFCQSQYTKESFVSALEKYIVYEVYVIQRKP